MFVFFLFFFPLSNFLGLFPLDKLLIESASFVLPPPWNGDKFFPSRVLLIINGLIGKRFIVLPLNSNTGILIQRLISKRNSRKHEFHFLLVGNGSTGWWNIRKRPRRAINSIRGRKFVLTREEDNNQSDLSSKPVPSLDLGGFR